jgi:hypothetical protein
MNNHSHANHHSLLVIVEHYGIQTRSYYAALNIELPYQHHITSITQNSTRNRNTIGPPYCCRGELRRVDLACRNHTFRRIVATTDFPCTGWYTDWLWRGQFPHAASEAALEDAKEARPAAQNATSPAENRWNHGIAVHAASHLQLRKADFSVCARLVARLS